MSTEHGTPDVPGMPDATALDGVRRLHVMAAGISGAQVTERIIPVPFPDVWALMSDLAQGLGEFQPDLPSVRVVSRAAGPDGDRLVAVARSRYGMRARFDVVLRPGWCWMQSRFLLIGMAATPVAGGTKVALTGGVRVPGRAAILPIGVKRESAKSLRRLAERFQGETAAGER